MYIKLNTIRLQYTKEVNDIFILAEVPDSTMSYENPVIVRTVDDLESWFGKNFTSYDYFVELLNRNISLYLYKPISTDIIKDSQYIDLSEYTVSPTIYPTPESLPQVGDPSTKYWVGGIYIDWDNLEDGGEVLVLPDEPDPDTKYLMNSTWYTYISSTWYSSNDVLGCFYIYLFDSWVSEKDLPQNTGTTSISQENRDTLLLSIPGSRNTITSCCPEYHESRLGVFSKDYSSFSLDTTQPTSIPGIESTYCFDLIWNGETDTLPDYYYLVLPDPREPDSYFLAYSDAPWDNLEDGGNVDNLPENPDLTKKYLYNGSWWAYFGSSWLCEDNRVDNVVPLSFIPEVDSMGRYLRNSNGDLVNTDYKNRIPSFTALVSFIKIFYSSSNIEEVQENRSYKIFSSIAIPVDSYFDFPGLSLTPNYKDTQNYLATNIREKDWGIEMWSKTIGRGDPDYEDDLITVQIDEIKAKEEYRFTISRFSYTEIFEGKLHPGQGEERLDYLVSRDSKLIHLRFDNFEEGLRTGTWKMRGAVSENYNPEMYWKGLEAMLDPAEIYPDYILIPDKTKWTRDISNPDYLEKFLKYCKALSCQTLIQNNLPSYVVKEVDTLPTWNEDLEDYILWTLGDGHYWKKGEAGLIEETNKVTIETSQNLGDFIYNYQNDPDNRLIYFFQGMSVYGRSRPGYYLYLLGLFSDIYSASATQINYNYFTSNPYVDEDFEKVLGRYKSNYLVGNNQIFYYKDYQNGESYTSTGWMRFAIGKITRELQRNKSKYQGKRNNVEIERNIKEVLNNIVRKFSIIDQIEITSFLVSSSENRITISLNTKVKDLVDNNMGLDITINYNE